MLRLCDAEPGRGAFRSEHPRAALGTSLRSSAEPMNVGLHPQGEMITNQGRLSDPL